MQTNSSSCYHTSLAGLELSPLPFCIRGLYCPWLSSNVSANPEICLPSDNCYRKRLEGGSCFGLENDLNFKFENDLNFKYGAQGQFEPIVCPPGYYCNSTTEIEACPARHFCPTGTIYPKPCDFLSLCPSGSVVHKSFQPIVISVGLDLLLLLLYFYLKGKRLHIGHLKIDESEQLDLKPVIQMSLDTQDLCCFIPSGKIILDQLSIHIPSSKMTLILGPSGSGKSTLIKVLTGQNQHYLGKILINNQELDIASFKKVVGLVPQQDSLLQELTVYETILHSATVRLPASLNSRQRRAHSMRIIKQLDLLHTKNQFISTLSGGERRRVSIGVELVSNPSCLFLDEPTTGLDSASALQLIRILEKMSNTVTIVCVLHQPRIELFRKFDKVLMLSNSGHIVYDGPTDYARNHFEDTLGFVFTVGSNEADIFLDIISGTGILKNKQCYSIEDLCELKEAIPKSAPTDNLMSKFSKKLLRGTGASFLNQLLCTHNLSLLQQCRKINEFVSEVISCSFTGSMVGIVMTRKVETYVGILKKPFLLLSSAPDFTNVVQIPFITCLVLTFSATPAGVKVFSDEIDTFKRWKIAGHNTLAYFLGKNLSVIYRIFLSSLHFASFAYYFSSPVFSFVVYFKAISLLYFAIYGLTSFVSFLVRRENATLFSITLVIFLGALSGYAPTLKKGKEYNLDFLYSLSYNRYAVEALFTETLRVYDHIYDTKAANSLYSFDLFRTDFDILMIFLIGVGWRVLAYVALVVKRWN